MGVTAAHGGEKAEAHDVRQRAGGAGPERGLSAVSSSDSGRSFGACEPSPASL